MLDRGSIEEEDAFIVLAVIYLLLLTIAAAIIYATKVWRNKGKKKFLEYVKERVRLVKEKKNYKEYAKQIALFLLDVSVVGSSIAYYVGNNINKATDEDLIVPSIIILLGAMLGFRIISSLKKLIQNFCEGEGPKDSKKSRDSEEQRNSEAPREAEEPKDDSSKQFIEKIYYATLRTLSLVPEVDASYTIFINLVNLMSDNCRMRNYNVLWVLYGGILVILIIEMFATFVSALKNLYKKAFWFWMIYSIIIVMLGVIGTGLFFVAVNEQPLDCSPHFRRIGTLTKEPITVTLHEVKNYRLRVAFLVVSLVCSCAIIVAAGLCWIYKFYNERDNKAQIREEMQQEREQRQDKMEQRQQEMEQRQDEIEQRQQEMEKRQQEMEQSQEDKGTTTELEDTNEDEIIETAKL